MAYTQLIQLAVARAKAKQSTIPVRATADLIAREIGRPEVAQEIAEHLHRAALAANVGIEPDNGKPPPG